MAHDDGRGVGGGVLGDDAIEASLVDRHLAAGDVAPGAGAADVDPAVERTHSVAPEGAQQKEPPEACRMEDARGARSLSGSPTRAASVSRAPGGGGGKAGERSERSWRGPCLAPSHLCTAPWSGVSVNRWGVRYFRDALRSP